MTAQALLPDLETLMFAVVVCAVAILIAGGYRAWRARRQRLRLAVLAHELRTPLDALGGLLELQYRQQATRQQESDLTRQAVICARELAALLDSLLAWASLGRRPPARQPARLDEIVHSVAHTFALQAAQRNQYLETRLGHMLDAPLLLDASRLRQILINLISNAIRHCAGGTITINVASERRDGGHAAVDIHIQDSGTSGRPGRGAAHPPHPGERQGSGLGLGICRELCVDMNATLETVPSQGEGTCLRLRFECPIADTEPPSNDTPITTGFDAAHVLLIDDNPSTRILLERQLTLLALDVTSSPDGAAALRQWRRQPFDLILCDRYMPLMDGIQFVRRVRRMERRFRLPRTPIIGLSAGTEAEFATVDVDATGPRPSTLGALQRLIRPFLRETEVATRLQLSALKQLTDDDPIFETEFLQSILQCNRQDIDRALHGYRHHDLDDLASPVHRLTGMARLICHPAIASRGSDVEKALRRGDEERVAHLLPLWLDDMQSLEREIERRLVWLSSRRQDRTAVAPNADQVSKS